MGQSPDGGDPRALGSHFLCYSITCVCFLGQALIKLQGYSGKQNRQGPQFRQLHQSNAVWKGKLDPNSQFPALPTSIVSSSTGCSGHSTVGIRATFLTFLGLSLPSWTTDLRTALAVQVVEDWLCGWMRTKGVFRKAVYSFCFPSCPAVQNGCCSGQAPRSLLAWPVWPRTPGILPSRDFCIQDP